MLRLAVLVVAFVSLNAQQPGGSPAVVQVAGQTPMAVQPGAQMGAQSGNPYQQGPPSPYPPSPYPSQQYGGGMQYGQNMAYQQPAQSMGYPMNYPSPAPTQGPYGYQPPMNAWGASQYGQPWGSQYGAMRSWDPYNSQPQYGSNFYNPTPSPYDYYGGGQTSPMDRYNQQSQQGQTGQQPQNTGLGLGSIPFWALSGNDAMRNIALMSMGGAGGAGNAMQQMALFGGLGDTMQTAALFNGLGAGQGGRGMMAAAALGASENMLPLLFAGSAGAGAGGASGRGNQASPFGALSSLGGMMALSNF